MDPFTFIVGGGLVVGLVLVLLIGYFYPGSGADVLDWKPTRSPEAEAELEANDIAQMLEAKNRRRRARGESELTEEDFERRVMEDNAERVRLAQEFAARDAEKAAAARAAGTETTEQQANREDAEDLEALLAAKRAARAERAAKVRERRAAAEAAAREHPPGA